MDGMAVEVVERAAERLSGSVGVDGPEVRRLVALRGWATWASPVEVPPDCQ
jgi:hypothetical protein